MYVSRVDLLPRPKEGKIIVNMRRIINTSGSFSGIAGADPKILEKGGVLCQLPWLAGE